MMKGLKIGLLVVLAFVVVTLLTLRATGLEPPYVDPSSEEFAKSGRTTRPGLWLTGEVVHEPVTNWDWVNKVNDPIRKNTRHKATPSHRKTIFEFEGKRGRGTEDYQRLCDAVLERIEARRSAAQLGGVKEEAPVLRTTP